MSEREAFEIYKKFTGEDSRESVDSKKRLKDLTKNGVELQKALNKENGNVYGEGVKMVFEMK